MSNIELETPETPDSSDTVEPTDDEKASTTANACKPYLGCWGGERIRVTIWIDKTVYSAFKPIARTRYGSVCCAVEGIMAGIAGAVEMSNASKYHSGDFKIENFNLYRNVRERRLLDPSLVDDADEAIRESEREKLRVKAIREEVRNEGSVKPEPAVDVGALIDELAVTVLGLYSERGLSGIGVVYDLMREVAVPMELQSQVRGRVVDLLVQLKEARG